MDSSKRMSREEYHRILEKRFALGMTEYQRRYEEIPDYELEEVKDALLRFERERASRASEAEIQARQQWSGTINEPFAQARAPLKGIQLGNHKYQDLSFKDSWCFLSASTIYVLPEPQSQSGLAIPLHCIWARSCDAQSAYDGCLNPIRLQGSGQAYGVNWELCCHTSAQRDQLLAAIHSLQQK